MAYGKTVTKKPTHPVSATEIELLERVNKDTRRAMQALTPDDVKVLVDLYYNIQEHRKAFSNQLWAAQENDEPASDFIGFTYRSIMRLEDNISKAMDEVSYKTDEGTWCRKIFGLGPVLTAGLLCHIDINLSPHVSSLWAYAGYAPGIEWYGRAKATALVDEYVPRKRHYDISDVYILCNKLEMSQIRTVTMLKFAQQLDKAKPVYRINEDVLQALQEDGLSTEILTQLNSIEGTVFKEREEFVEALRGCIDVKISRNGENLIINQSEYREPKAITRDKIIHALARRPWNAKLRTLCWKVGDQFVKAQNQDKDIYGKIYKSQKDLYKKRNDQGLYKERAAKILTDKNFTKLTETKKAYEEGRLPDGHIDMMARRYATKRFLSHLWVVMYESKHGYGSAPDPWIVTHGGHDPSHISRPPFWPPEDASSNGNKP